MNTRVLLTRNRFLASYANEEAFVCLLVLRLNVPVNNFSVMSGVLWGVNVSYSRTQHGDAYGDYEDEVPSPYELLAVVQHRYKDYLFPEYK